MLKVCFKCKVPQELTKEFYRHPATADGHLNKCKTCTKSDVQANYSSTREQRSLYEKERNKRPERRRLKAQYGKTHRNRYPEKVKARRAVNIAIRDGRLERLNCQVCGERAQAHHEDYSEPFNVEWLCFKHHREHGHGQTVTSEYV